MNNNISNNTIQAMSDFALGIVYDIQDEYCEELKKLNLGDVCENLGMVLNCIGDVKVFAKLLCNRLFNEIIHNDNFLELPVLKHFAVGSNEYFAYAEIGEAKCEECNLCFPVYKCIYIGENCYGIADMVDENYPASENSGIAVFDDVLPFIEKKMSELNNVKLGDCE